MVALWAVTMKQWLLRHPEIAFTGAFAALTMAVAAIVGVPFSLPGGERAAFVGIHYLYPLLGVAAWGVFAAFGQRRNLSRTFLIALPCYAVVLICHFNLKLWIPHINPALWDDFYWQTDILLRPIVDGCIALRAAIAPIIGLESNFYMIAFIAMFYISFCVHALRNPHDFRTLFLAALIFQGMGAIAYLVMPAIGPFLYETGIEPAQTSAQLSMLEAYRANVQGGSAWIAAHGSTHLTVGLAAMPSLHTGGSFLFLLFAWRYARVLMPLYLLLFVFISIDAVASRWHYVIDLPIGMLLALGSAWAAEMLNPKAAQAEAEDISTPAPSGAFLARLSQRFKGARTSVS